MRTDRTYRLCPRPEQRTAYWPWILLTWPRGRALDLSYVSCGLANAMGTEDREHDLG